MKHCQRLSSFWVYLVLPISAKMSTNNRNTYFLFWSPNRFTKNNYCCSSHLFYSIIKAASIYCWSPKLFGPSASSAIKFFGPPKCLWSSDGRRNLRFLGLCPRVLNTPLMIFFAGKWNEDHVYHSSFRKSSTLFEVYASQSSGGSQMSEANEEEMWFITAAMGSAEAGGRLEVQLCLSFVHIGPHLTKGQLRRFRTQFLEIENVRTYYELNPFQQSSWKYIAKRRNWNKFETQRRNIEKVKH